MKKKNLFSLIKNNNNLKDKINTKIIIYIKYYNYKINKNSFTNKKIILMKLFNEFTVS